MKQVFLVARQLWRDDRAVTSIEYALIASLIAMAILASVALLGTNLSSLYDRIQDCVVSPSTC